LVIEQFNGSWSSLLQLFLDNCPDLETINLSGNSFDNAIGYNGAIVQLQGSFVALREFRLSGTISDQMYTVVSKMVVQSSDTLEVLYFDRWHYGRPVEKIANPFHIAIVTSWTRCKRLKELGLCRQGGTFLNDPCWEAHLPSSVEATKDYGTVLGQLEKLRLGVKEQVLQECRNIFGGMGNVGHQSWGGYDSEEYYSYFDEKDDEDWRPLKDAVRKTKEEKAQEYETRRVERCHQQAFILRVRELFGRLKDLKQLRELDIEWVVCPSIQNMSLELALELFKETEAKEYSGSSGQNDTVNNTVRTSKGWWGEVTQDDLVWLCLPWSPQPVIKSSGIPSRLIIAAARQYENKSQLPGCCDDTNSRCNHDPQPWSTGDIYKARVGRTWKDWMGISYDDYPYAEMPYDFIRPFWHYWKFYQEHTMNSRDFEVFVEGDAEDWEEALWGKKKATRGEGGRYRQKAIGKRNQRK
jgi:hypothetical protein